MMARIRSGDTKPEMFVRKGLHAAGLRFRLHVRKLPGSPDIVLPKYKSVIFVHGCFWHGHIGCNNFKLPKTRADFWATKIEGNCERDRRSKEALLQAGWRVLVIWECATRILETEKLVGAVTAWLSGAEGFAELSSTGLLEDSDTATLTCAHGERLDK
ncbi:DNA mismatch endonuclease Vsr [Rhizobium leguminosarum bv. viciae]|nr:DNA mismatch endonuclease Vsr [Rhizobium leguminosarum bv. viciae]